MIKAKVRVDQERKLQASMRCQRHIRGYLARVKTLSERSRKCMIVRIQRFYRRRFNMKQRFASVVQRLLKRRLVLKKVTRLKSIA